MVSWKGYGPQIQTLGCTIHQDGTLEFGLWAPHAKAIKVILSNGVECELVQSPKPEVFHCKIKQEVWNADTAQSSSSPLGLTYHYEIEPSWNDCFSTEGAILSRRDPYARLTDFESNECFVPVWESPLLTPNSPFFVNYDSRPSWSNSALNIYELHVGSFPKRDPDDKNCFSSIPLDHIYSSGFNAIELMPVQEFGGSWGYNPRLLMAIHPFFGTPCDLREFVIQCHKKSLKVILDIVLNHGSAKRNSLWNFDGYGPNNNGGIYFQNGKETGWGRQFNFESSQVLHYIRDACRYFVEMMNVDGLRFDSVHNMQYRFTKELLVELKRAYPDRFFIAEVTPEDPKVCRDLHFDSVWVHADYYDAMKLLKDGRNEWDTKMLANIVNGHSHFETGSEMISSILGSHDQVGNRHDGRSDDPRIGRYMVSQLGGRDNWHARAQVRMLFALQGFGRQIPMTFQGADILQADWWNVDPGHHWNAHLVEGKDLYTSQFMTMVKDVNALRGAFIALQSTKQPAQVCHSDAQNLVLAFIRPCGSGGFLLVVNWSENQWQEGVVYDIQTPWKNKAIRPLFNSQAEEYGGWDSSWSAPRNPEGAREIMQIQESGFLSIVLPKWSTLLFKLESS
eukprot:Gregarina_sp_Pseudo_9__5809@NODE_87_length_4395_cov_6_813361_g79_i0_p2_GENE_NODE_87_length_4395_cov_6_813361_g79_i0NODE_87_length_4395_cov_6_813361_g79_i0_p2_ORF_typecomplete_len620_score56_07Alphaamylase/PF00128_24/1_5e42CBM_48/PF02922_18/2_8e06Alphaamylase_C/PF02806_18/5_1e06hDGE_amylase/PF14701_6/7_4e05hDGE_amylase/PF14701_6/1e03GHL10/PF02638_15/0_00045GHL5/PF14872_6/2_2GHL5/PF14872_6/2_6Melibiase/PF02065_18/0_027_NODE_87_length_4395_cov_6_813361_g79_i023474206